jgi:hypothetical protein
MGDVRNLSRYGSDAGKIGIWEGRARAREAKTTPCLIYYSRRWLLDVVTLRTIDLSVPG